MLIQMSHFFPFLRHNLVVLQGQLPASYPNLTRAVLGRKIAFPLNYYTPHSEFYFIFKILFSSPVFI